MKRYLKGFKFTEEFVRQAIDDCFKGKKMKRRDTQAYLRSYNYDRDAIAHDIFVELNNHEISLPPIKYKEICDNSNNKMREIGVCHIKQQVYDYIVVNACKKMFNAKIGLYQCASIKGRGQIYGKRAIKRWLQNDRKGTKYVYKCDVKKYFPSVNQKILINLLARDIKNNEVLYLLKVLIGTYKSGLCIGSFLSQYLANYYLSYAYHFITENSFKMKHGKRYNNVSHALFYMDDIILFSSNKRSLATTTAEFKQYLKDNLDLSIKDNDRLFKMTDGECIDMMGFKIFRNRTIIRKRIWRRIYHLYCICKKLVRLTLRQCRKWISYFGWIKNTNHVKLFKRYKIMRFVNIARRTISNENRILQAA